MLEVLGIKNYQKLVPMADDKKPADPVTENQNVLSMKPVKAFLYQDHPAHIQVHMAAMQDPKIMELVGQSPMAQAIGAAMQAHIAEHLGFEYRKQMERQMGVDLPTTNEVNEDGIPKAIEVRVSQLAAQAAQQLLQQNQQEAQEKKNAQMQQDPLVQMQQQELQIKQEELQLKKQKLQVDAASKADQLKIEEARIAAQKEIAGMQVGAKTAKDKAQQESKDKLEGLRAGADIAYKNAQLQQSKEQSRGANKKGD
jgi:hypothetical protein